MDLLQWLEEIDVALGYENTEEVCDDHTTVDMLDVVEALTEEGFYLD